MIVCYLHLDLVVLIRDLYEFSKSPTPNTQRKAISQNLRLNGVVSSRARGRAESLTPLTTPTFLKTFHRKPN